MSQAAAQPKVHIAVASDPRAANVLTTEAVSLLAEVHARFEPTRQALLAERKQFQARIDAGRVWLPAAP